MVDRMQNPTPRVNILMVDDNESNLLALETILQGDDRNLVRAASGDEALQYLLDNDAAVILLDVRMPGISGLETAELIRGRQKTRDIPIIFLTAYDSADRQDLSKGYSLGAVDYIIKPLDPDALQSKVAVFVELSKKTEQVKQQAALLHEKNIELENANMQRLGKLVELGQRLTAERDPEALLQLFCDAARDILGARYAYVRIMETTGESSGRTRSGAFDLATAKAEVRRIDAAISSAAASKYQPLRVSNLRDLAELGEANSLISLLAAPIAIPEQPAGWLYLVDKLKAEEFSEADERLAMTLTGQLAVAYENARLYAAAQQHASDLLQEVTERKQAQEQKEELLLSEKAARAAAEAANRMKDEFLATVSHELRTPLNSILGWAQLLRTGSFDEESSNRALHTIERNTRTLAQIIEDLLDVSRIITGKLLLDVKPIELRPVVEAALDSIRPATDAKNIRLQVLLDGSVGPISGDVNRLQQIVWNLLSNAIKFTPSGGHVDVRLERVEGSARITVTDDGEGISEEFLPYVFDRFRQADSTFARSHGGLGLGLAIVRHLVEMHGGTVGADSAGRGKGATFTVSFPLLNAKLHAPSDIKQQMGEMDEYRPASEEPQSLVGLSVLIVDDEREQRDVLVAMLEERGAQVMAASSAGEALAALRNVSNGSLPDVLISDIGMPGEDGFDLITQVRALRPERAGNIPAIALTAYARAEDRARVLAAGFQRHVAKPVESSALAAAVVNLARPAARA